MRHAGLSVLLFFCLLPLAGCGQAGQARQLSGQIAHLYASVQTVDARLSMRVNRGSLESDFVLDWQYRAANADAFAGAESRSRVTVAAPAAVAGIAVEATADGSVLYYDGAVLSLSADEALAGAFDGPAAPSPLAALPLLFAQWRSGGCSAYAMENLDGLPALALTYSETRGESVLEQRVWFDAELLTPLFAELSWNGRRLVTCRFETFTLS